jgi:hypothetical protein
MKYTIATVCAIASLVLAPTASAALLGDLTASTSLGVSVGAQSTTTTGTTSVSTNAVVETGADLDVDVSGDDTRSMADIDLSISTAAQVETAADLQAYVRTVSYNDRAVERIEADADEVVVTYRHPAKFLGFINVTMEEEIVVEADAEGRLDVDVDRPWWAVLATADASARDVSSRVMARLSNVPRASLEGEMDASTRARLVSEVHAAVQASYGMQAN